MRGLFQNETAPSLHYFLRCTSVMLMPIPLFFDTYAALLRLRMTCITTPRAIRPRPMKSVSEPGMISARPPPMVSRRSTMFMFVRRYPDRPAATPIMPSVAVMVISTTSYHTVSMNSSAGDAANTKGMMNAPMASRVAVTPVFIGLPLAMAAPA